MLLKGSRKVVLQEASLLNISLQKYLATDSLLFLGCSAASFLSLAAGSSQAAVTPLLLLWELVYVSSECETTICMGELVLRLLAVLVKSVGVSFGFARHSASCFMSVS